MGDLDPLAAASRQDGEADLRTPEDAADGFGIRTALLVTSVGFLIAAIWLMNSPSFEKCSGLANLKDRVTCYEGLRNAALKPPAK